MKTRNTLSTAALAGLLAATAWAGDWVSDPVATASQQRVAPWVISHRGFSGEYPENTMRSFREAIRAGSDALEMDVQRTKDGRLVVLHDDVLDRTTDGHGPVGALTFAQVQALDAGRWKGRQFAGERIPALEEVLRLARQAGVGLVVEAKTPYALDPTLAEAIVQMCDREGVTSRTILQSFDHRPLGQLHAKRPDVKMGPLLDAGIDDMEAMLKAAGTWALLPDFAFMLPDRIRTIHRLGYHVAVWTVDSLEHMKLMIAGGVDGIMTNRTPTLVRLLKELRLPRRAWPH